MRATRVLISTGEPAGIGPEIAVRLLAKIATEPPTPGLALALVGDANLLKGLASRYAPTLKLGVNRPFDSLTTGATIWHVPLEASVQTGRLNPANAAYVLETLDISTTACQRGDADALVTCPISKSVINDAALKGLGFFQGHTEYLAAKTATKQVVMLLAGACKNGAQMRVALATTHLPLKEVAAALSVAGLLQTIRILDADLRQKFGLSVPRIGVCGLNPHAGEAGHLGREELDIIAPALTAARGLQIDARGPYPADTIFAPPVLSGLDCVLAMYHDQGLPTLKYATFGHGINVTLGLPIIRTSVDHGTALDIAGQGVAQLGSLETALQVAVQMVHATKKNLSQ